MRTGVVILSYGAHGLHAELVSRLLSQGLARDSLLVVHNPDGSAAGAEPAPIDGVSTLVMDRNVGYGAAMNAGLEHWAARGCAWVLLLTHDVRPLPGALEALSAAAAGDHDYGVLGPTLVSAEDGRPYSYGGLDGPRNITEHRETEPAPDALGIAACDWVDGTAQLVRTRAFREAGPLDSSFFMYFEEPDFCLRVREARWRVGVVLGARMATAPGRGKRALAYGYLFARNGLRYAHRAGGRRRVAEAIRSQLRMSWWLAAKPYNRRFYDREFLRVGYANAIGLCLGMCAAATRQAGAPPALVRRLSDIAGTTPGSPAGGAARPLRVVMFPDLLSTDPYSDLLDDALRRRGIVVERGTVLDRRWAREAVGQVDAVHLHWLEFLFYSSGSRLRRLGSMYAQGLRVIGALRLLRASRVRVIWTVHSPSPNETAYPRLLRRLRGAVLRAADAVVAHSEYAAGKVRESLSFTAPVHVAPHGGYVGVYPPATETRAQTRARRGIPADAFVYLIFGHVRDYKRVPQAVAAFRELPDEDARLLVVGLGGPPRAATEAAASGDPRVLLDLRSLPDEEVANVFGAADVLVLNYSEVFSSGALLLAQAYGLPVVAPAEGSAIELAPPPATVPFAEGELVAALSAARREPESRRRAAAAAAAAASWDESARVLESIYRGDRPAASRPPAAAGSGNGAVAEPATSGEGARTMGGVSA